MPRPLSAPDGELRTDASRLDDAAAVRMARRFETAGDLASASNMYRRALQRAPENTEALLGLARIYSIAGAREESARYYRRILKLQPQNSQAATAVAEDLIFREKPQEAVRFVNDFMGGARGTASLYNLLAIGYDLLDAHSEAQLAYAEGLGLSPDDGAITSNLALSFAVRSDYQTAIALLERVLDTADKGDEEGQSIARQNLALVYALSGQLDAAVNIARTVLSEAEVDINRKFYARLPALSSRQKARAVFLGSLPSLLDVAEEPGPGAAARVSDESARETVTTFAPLTAPPDTEEGRDAAAARIIRGEFAETPAATNTTERAAPPSNPAPEPASKESPVTPADMMVEGREGLADETEFPAVAVSPDAYPPYWVQLGSYRSPERARAGWKTLSVQFPDLLAGYLGYIQTHESEARGLFFRLMVQASETRSAANLVCQTFKIAGMDCLVIETGGGIEPLFPEAQVNGVN